MNYGIGFDSYRDSTCSEQVYARLVRPHRFMSLTIKLSPMFSVIPNTCPIITIEEKIS